MKHRMKPLLGTFLVAAGLVAAASGAARAAYPDRLMTGIIPFAPGGPSDVLSRVVGIALAQELGQTIVMENRPGAAGNVGIAQVAHSNPDGYTLLFCSVATTQNPAVFKKLPYDPLKDIQPVAQFGESPHFIAVNAARVPVNTLPEFLDLVRKNPDKYNLSSAGGDRMSLVRFLEDYNLKMGTVTYASGGEAATALMSGEVDARLPDGATANIGYDQGKVKLLAVNGPERLPAFAAIPTTKEVNEDVYHDYGHVGLYAAAGTPPDIVNKLNAAVNKVLDRPDVADRFGKLGYLITHKTPAQFDDFYKGEIARWKELAEKNHLPTVD